MIAPRTVHLLDASPYIFRAYFSLPPALVDEMGAPAHAVHGFVAFLLRYLEDERPTHIAVAFDESLTTSFRNEIYPAYKSNRELPPPDLEAQLRGCQDCAAALGLAIYKDDRYEADDLLATLEGRFAQAGHRCVVVSSDKDLAQLVHGRTEFYDYARQQRLGPAEVRARFGVDPDQIADLLALAGDAVDGIPGVPGVGPKTAVALLEHFGTMERVYAGLDQVPDLPIRGARSVARKLGEGRDLAHLSKRLTVAARDAPAPGGLREIARRAPRAAALEGVFTRWRLGRYLGRASAIG